MFTHLLNLICFVQIYYFGMDVNQHIYFQRITQVYSLGHRCIWIVQGQSSSCPRWLSTSCASHLTNRRFLIWAFCTSAVKRRNDWVQKTAMGVCFSIIFKLFPRTFQNSCRVIKYNNKRIFLPRRISQVRGVICP